MIRYASIIEHESLKAEIIMCPAGAYYENHLINKQAENGQSRRHI